MRLAAGEQVPLELLAGPSQHRESPLESIGVAIVADEVRAAALAFDHDGAGPGRAASRSVAAIAGEEGRIEAGTIALQSTRVEERARGVIQPAGGVDAVLRDRTPDFGRDGAASESGEPRDAPADDRTRALLETIAKNTTPKPS